ncbi:unnamed protein product [Rotaria sordida]|uniref:Uncharacterized protein n=1 Tax=Rotaria sordida TaxID=392033 RepID=A0A815BXL2_9BILA|nr:unnamed protein product [Rotaria sordida]CAF1276254.1 unnamed protein product [Rotaria sordida]CAF1398347.1 unnamed protein product [Rotaria sordida]CAF1555546.1 unnamed protein product [Rotaria sordida]CAF4082665.1 unnamed protein product [Rotaria sordida]
MNIFKRIFNVLNKIALANDVRIIWLDTHIGQEKGYENLKKMLCKTLEEADAVSPDTINVLIWTLEQSVAQFLFAHTPEKAKDLIEIHHDKQIIFIPSEFLGKKIIPELIRTYSYIYRYYFFCENITNYVEFGLDYISCL